MGILIVGAKQLFSWEMLKLLVITAVIALLSKNAEEKLCEWFTSYCFWITQFIIVVYLLLMFYFVMIPFAKLFGIKVTK